LYNDLYRIAESKLRGHLSGTLSPAVLVSELYVRLAQWCPEACKDRAQFLTIAAKVMRNIFVDYVRTRGAVKRGAHAVRQTLHDVVDAGSLRVGVDLLDIDRALQEFETLYSRQAKVFEAKFFAGMTDQKIAGSLKISVATAKRDTLFARAWLETRLAEMS